MSPSKDLADVSIQSTARDSIQAGFDTVLVAPTTRAVFADRVDGVFDGLEKEGGRVVGRSGSDWKADVRAWIKQVI